MHIGLVSILLATTLFCVISAAPKPENEQSNALSLVNVDNGVDLAKNPPNIPETDTTPEDQGRKRRNRKRLRGRKGKRQRRVMDGEEPNNRRNRRRQNRRRNGRKGRKSKCQKNSDCKKAGFVCVVRKTKLERHTRRGGKRKLKGVCKKEVRYNRNKFDILPTPSS